MAKFKEMDRGKAKEHLQVARKGLVKLPKGAQARNAVQRLRVDAAYALGKMRQAARKRGLSLKVASAWRKPWKSRAAYEAFLLKKYKSISKGKKWVAYESFHHRGVAVDFGSDGLAPTKDTRERQKTTKAYKWLKANAHKYGFYNYSPEPWHWEFRPVGIPATPPSEPWQVEADFNPGAWALAGTLALAGVTYFATEGDPLSLPSKVQAWTRSVSRQTASPAKRRRATRSSTRGSSRLATQRNARGAA